MISRLTAWAPALAVVVSLGAIPPSPPADAHGRLRLLVGEGVPLARAEGLAEAAAAVLSSQGVCLPDGSAWRRERIAGTPALAQPDASDLSAFLRRHAQPHDPGGLALAVLPHVAQPDSIAADTLGDLVGLGLSPSSSPAPDATPFTPIAIVSLAALDRLPGPQRSFAVAHELLHALGLTHVADADNIMAPAGAIARAGKTVPGIEGDQRRAANDGRACAPVAPTRPTSM